jgi:hypothetical protein
MCELEMIGSGAAVVSPSTRDLAVADRYPIFRVRKVLGASTMEIGTAFCAARRPRCVKCTPMSLI